MRTKLNSDLVAQFKGTVMVTAEGPVRNTRALQLPYVHSQFCIPQATTAATVLSTPEVKEIRQAKPLATVDVTFGDRRIQKEDVEMDME
ncbi:hypothetical protein G6F42_026830 [Rhizopus arrhizus]|nr:hypothetical protein G6F42_026830 [Rhizopus arrhizus]